MLVSDAQKLALQTPSPIVGGDLLVTFVQAVTTEAGG
jgi:hypothetical protein